MVYQLTITVKPQATDHQDGRSARLAKGKKRLRLKKHMAALVAQSEQEQETIIDLPLTAIRPQPLPTAAQL